MICLCLAPIGPHPRTTCHWGSWAGGRPTTRRGLGGGKEGLWGWGWLSVEQRRRQGTSQHTPVPTGKASRGWGQALPSPPWWEGERQWHLLKLKRFRLEIRHQNQNPREDHEALERVARRGGGMPEPGGQPARPEWPPPRAQLSQARAGMLAEVPQEKELPVGKVAKDSKGATASVSYNARRPLPGSLQFRRFRKH